jgi:hypothetical protein
VTPAAPDERRPTSAAWIYARFALALAVSVGLLHALVRRREARLLEAHRAAVARTARAPGAVVEDPTLPAGVVVVDIVPADAEMPLFAPATLRVGGRHELWAPDEPAWFDDLPRDRRHTVVVVGPYLVAGSSITVPPGDRGGRVAIAAIPIEASLPPQTEPGFAPEKFLQLDAPSPERLVLGWRQGSTRITEHTLAGGEGLVERLALEWRAVGEHRDPSDRKIDQIVIRIPPTASFGEVFPLVEAALATERDMMLGGVRRRVPVFGVSVQYAPP